MAGLFSWQGKNRSILSVVICTSSQISLCLSPRPPDGGTVCQTAPLLPPRLSSGLRREITSSCNLLSLISPASPPRHCQHLEGQLQTAEGSRPMKRTRQETGLELVPEKRLQEMEFVSALRCVQWYSAHFTSLSLPHPSPADSVL